ncbi:hypothetical protein NHX12_018761, partial [Muraenolepis orangiensis]
TAGLSCKLSDKCRQAWSRSGNQKTQIQWSQFRSLQVIPPRGKASLKLIFIPLEKGNEDTSNITILGLLLECNLSKSLLSNHQGSCLQSEASLSLQIDLSERGEPPGDLDKLKPYILEHILVLLMAPAPAPTSTALSPSPFCFSTIQNMQLLSKVQADLEFNQLPLKAQAKNFTQVAMVACRGASQGEGSRCSQRVSLQVLSNLTAHTFPGLQSLHRESGWDLSGLVQVRQSGRATDQVDLWFTNPFPLALTITNPRLSQRSRGTLKVVNFAGPLIVPQGCWHVLSLQLLGKALPVHLLSSLRLDSSLGAPLHIPLYLQSSLTKWQSNKEQLPCRWPRLPLEINCPLNFDATPVNESKVKLFTLKNPSSSVVSVEIGSLSQYPAPLEALDLLTRWFNISPLSVNVSTTEFTLLQRIPKPWESREVAVVFTPSEHKPTTTILVIRNNLTVFDMLTVRGHGAKEMLRIGGKLPGPGASLRFNVPQSTLMECRDGLRTSKPLFAIRKSFKVENAGELPLTVVSMNINGYQCQGFGFEVLQCRPFSLYRNSSSELTIAFTPDFTSSWVIRDLTLVTSRGSSFPFTLNVTLPHHMLPLCAQVVPGPSWEDSFWVFTLIFTCLSLFGVCLMAVHQAQYILDEFHTPGHRSNHSSVLSRHKVPVNNITHTGVGAASQPQKKHRASLHYTKYKPEPEVPNHNNDDSDDEVVVASCSSGPAEKPKHFKEGPFLPQSVEDQRPPPPAMFPMETPAGFPHDVTVGPGPRPGLLACSPARKSVTKQRTDDWYPDRGEVPEHSVLVMSEREKKAQEQRPGDHAAGGTRTRTHFPNNTRTDAPKPGPSNETPPKQNGVCLPRSRRKCAVERRAAWDSGTVQYNTCPAERDCYQNLNTTCKAQSMNVIYSKDQCQNMQPSAPSFASVTAGVERNMDLIGHFVPEETWSAPSAPFLTDEFMYNGSKTRMSAPQPPTPGPYHGFPWNSAISQCSSRNAPPYGYCEQTQSSYMMGNVQNFPIPSFPCQETQAGYSQQPIWSDECPQETPPSVWDAPLSRAEACGQVPYYHGTRSLSPMSSLFGSIWTPQSEPYPGHFQADRSAPVSPVSPVAPVHPSLGREPGGPCRPLPYTSFNPFGPHMNLDIWTSSSNRSSNSQLSNDSGYCGDV